MSWTRDVNDTELSFLDQTVEVDIDEILTGSSAKVSKETNLDISESQGAMQERVLVEQVDLKVCEKYTCLSQSRC